MIIWMVMIDHKSTKSQYCENAFLYKDNAEEHAETLMMTLNEEFSISVEPFSVIDAEEDTIEGYDQ